MTGGRELSQVLVPLPRTWAALGFAAEHHAGQRRAADGAPFIAHPIEVGTLLYQAGAGDDVIAAGVLHDTIEKTSTDREELVRRFGARTAALVAALTEDEQISGYETRKAALRRQVEAAGTDALLVFAADKVSKIRELPVERSGSEAETVSQTRGRKIRHYGHSLEMLERHIADSPLVVQLRAELEKRTGVPSRRQALADAV